MNIYVWHQIDKCTSSYHSEGGVVAIAESEERARELAKVEGAYIELHESPDMEHKLEDDHTAESVYLFPNAGCC